MDCCGESESCRGKQNGCFKFGHLLNTKQKTKHRHLRNHEVIWRKRVLGNCSDGDAEGALVLAIHGLQAVLVDGVEIGAAFCSGAATHVW